MGSILSFPILCLVSFTAWAISYGFAEKYLSIAGQDKSQSWAERMKLHSEAMVGVNGDDIVFPAEDRGEAWVDGVAAVGGRVSRGKSITAKNAFTINSEIWCREDDAWVKPCSIRPSLLFGILDGRTAFPEESWDEYARSELLSGKPDIQAIIVDRLKPHLPKNMGGIGKIKEFKLFDVLAWKVKTENNAQKRTVRPKSRWTPSQLRKVDQPKVRVVCSKSVAALVRKKERHDFRGLPEWTARGSTGPIADVRRAFKYVTRAEVRNLKEEWLYRWKLSEKGRKITLINQTSYSFAQSHSDSIKKPRSFKLTHASLYDPGMRGDAVRELEADMKVRFDREKTDQTPKIWIGDGWSADVGEIEWRCSDGPLAKRRSKRGKVKADLCAACERESVLIRAQELWDPEPLSERRESFAQTFGFCARHSYKTGVGLQTS